MSNYIPSFYFYKFASAVSAPYTNLEAYKSGAIDETGNILGNEGTIDEFEYFVIKLKKIFEQLSARTTKYKLQNLYGVIQLFSEEVEKFKIPKDQFNFFVESQIMLDSPIESSYLMLTEDMTTGGIAGGIGTPDKNDKVNTGIVSGYDPVLGFSEPRSSPINMISSVEMFNVSPQEFKSFKNSKTWKYIPDSKTKNYLQRYQRRNKQAKMAVRDEETGEVYFIPYKEKTFMEEFGLTNLTFLFEEKEDEKIIPIEPTSKSINQLLKKLRDQYVQHVSQTTRTDYSKTIPGQDLKDKGQSEEYYGRLVHTIDSLHKFHKERNNKDSKIKDVDQQFASYLGHLNKLSQKKVSDPGADTWGWSPEKGIHKIDIKKSNFTLRKPLATTDIPTISSPSTQKELEKMIELAGTITPKSKTREKKLVRGGLAERGSDAAIRKALMQIFAEKLDTDLSIARTLVPDVRDPSVGGKLIPSKTLQTWAQDEISTTVARPMIHYPNTDSPATVRIQKPELHGRKGGKQWKEFLSKNQNLEQPSEFSLTPSHFESLRDIMKDDDLYKQFYTDHHLQALINLE